MGVLHGKELLMHVTWYYTPLKRRRLNLAGHVAEWVWGGE
jgi:hypothetical protein